MSLLCPSVPTPQLFPPQQPHKQQRRTIRGLLQPSWSNSRQRLTGTVVTGPPSRATSAARPKSSARAGSFSRSARGACRSRVASESERHGARPSWSNSRQRLTGTVVTGTPSRATSAARPTSSASGRSSSRSPQGACKSQSARECGKARPSCSSSSKPWTGTAATGPPSRATSAARPASSAR